MFNQILFSVCRQILFDHVAAKLRKDFDWQILLHHKVLIYLNQFITLDHFAYLDRIVLVEGSKKMVVGMCLKVCYLMLELHIKYNQPEVFRSFLFHILILVILIFALQFLRSISFHFSLSLLISIVYLSLLLVTLNLFD